MECARGLWILQEVDRRVIKQATIKLAPKKRHTYLHQVIHINTNCQSRDDAMLGCPYLGEISQYIVGEYVSERLGWDRNSIVVIYLY